jgi:hypothetical protein
MARRKRKRSRRKSFSVLNALEAYVYATILTEGVAGTGPIGFITGEGDLGYMTTTTSDSWHGSQTLSTTVVGAGEISLADIVKEPGMAISTMSANFQANLAPMALAAFGTSITFRIGKRLLRRPIANINRNIMKPALGAGIKL